MNAHNCKACEGTGKVISKSTSIIKGKRVVHERQVECPNKLAEMFDTRRLSIDERQVGEKEET